MRWKEVLLLLMEEFLNHLGCIKRLNNGIDYQPQLVSRISEPSTVSDALVLRTTRPNLKHNWKLWFCALAQVASHRWVAIGLRGYKTNGAPWAVSNCGNSFVEPYLLQHPFHVVRCSWFGPIGNQTTFNTNDWVKMNASAFFLFTWRSFAWNRQGTRTYVSSSKV